MPRNIRRIRGVVGMSKPGNQYALGNDGGRPTKYDPKFVRELEEFFSRPAYEEKTITIRRKDGSTEERQELVACEFPTLAEFAVNIGVHRDTLHQWAKDHPEFSDAYQRAKAHQERILVSNGLTGRYEQPFAIFTAKNVLNWRDKSEVTSAISFEQDSTNDLKDRATKLAQKLGISLPNGVSSPAAPQESSD